MADGKAAKLASEWRSQKQRHEEDDLKGHGLPKHVQDAILAVEEASWDIHERVELAEALHATAPDDDYALEPGGHRQTSWAQQFEEVDGEVIEITKESAKSPVKLTHRPDLKAAGQVDPRSALEARFQTPLSEEEQGAAQRAAEELAATQARED